MRSWARMRSSLETLREVVEGLEDARVDLRGLVIDGVDGGFEVGKDLIHLRADFL